MRRVLPPLILHAFTAWLHGSISFNLNVNNECVNVNVNRVEALILPGQKFVKAVNNAGTSNIYKSPGGDSTLAGGDSGHSDFIDQLQMNSSLMPKV
jgi:hypothetical protein